MCALIYWSSIYYAGVDGAVETITTYTSAARDIHVVVSSNNTNDPTHGATKCTVFKLTEAILSGKEF